MMGLKGTPLMTNRKQRRHTPEQIIRKLAEGNKLLAGGMSIEEVCRKFGIAESTWHRWLSRYAKRLKELEEENARLKRMVADQALDIDMLKHLNEKKW
jgi:transposase-like protein